jgi:hypothetical protein
MSDISTILNRWTDSVHESVADLLGYNNADEVGVSELAMATVGSAVAGAAGGAVAHVTGVVGVIAGIGCL